MDTFGGKWKPHKKKSKTAGRGLRDTEASHEVKYGTSCEKPVFTFALEVNDDVY